VEKMSLNYEEYTPLNQRKETKMCYLLSQIT